MIVIGHSTRLWNCFLNLELNSIGLFLPMTLFWEPKWKRSPKQQSNSITSNNNTTSTDVTQISPLKPFQYGCWTEILKSGMTHFGQLSGNLVLLKTHWMSYSRPFSISITPAEDIILTCNGFGEFLSVVDKGEQSTTSISVLNSNDQKVIIILVFHVQIILKLRSNAGKLLRIKQNLFAIDSKQTISFDSDTVSFGW